MKTKPKPLEAIRNKCMDCSVYSKDEVRKCTAVACPLWLLRFGKLNSKKLFFTHEQEELWREKRGDVEK